MDNKIVVADAGPLVAFGRINSLWLLSEILGLIIIPETVAAECITNTSKKGASMIQEAIDNEIIKVHENTRNGNQEFSDILDAGEAAAIALALKLKTGLLIDEKLGRSVAKKLKLKIIGTAGVILLAKKNKLINKVFPLINDLKDAGYYLSNNLISEVLRQAKEEAKICY